jgi:hypothetical protein
MGSRLSQILAEEAGPWSGGFATQKVVRDWRGKGFTYTAAIATTKNMNESAIK